MLFTRFAFLVPNLHAVHSPRSPFLRQISDIAYRARGDSLGNLGYQNPALIPVVLPLDGYAHGGDDEQEEALALFEKLGELSGSGSLRYHDHQESKLMLGGGGRERERERGYPDQVLSGAVE